MAKKEPPPPPPPRPHRAHMRSSSLDLNKLGIFTQLILTLWIYNNNQILGKFGAMNSTQGPPVVPPRITPSPVCNVFHTYLLRIYRVIFILEFKY